MQRGEEEIAELVNAVIDGVATVQQRAEVERLAAIDPQVREMLDLGRRLDAMPEIEPPEKLKPNVMKQVWGRASAGPRRARARRYTFAALWAAAAMFVLVFLMIGRQQMTDTGATMAPDGKPRIMVTRNGDLITIEAIVAPTRPQVVSIAWDPSSVDFVGFLDKKDASFRKTKVEFTLRDPRDRAGVIVRPRRGASAMAVGVSVNGTEVSRMDVALR